MKRQTAWHGVSFRAGRAFRDAAAWLPPLTLQCNEPTRAKSRPHVNCLETRQDCQLQVYCSARTGGECFARGETRIYGSGRLSSPFSSVDGDCLYQFNTSQQPVGKIVKPDRYWLGLMNGVDGSGCGWPRTSRRIDGRG
jgi:hypothetical protein